MKRKVTLLGAVNGILCSVAVFFATFALLMGWLAQFPMRPDFGTNGLLWITTSILTVNLLLVSLFLVLAFSLVIPIWAKHARVQTSDILVETAHNEFVKSPGPIREKRVVVGSAVMFTAISMGFLAFTMSVVYLAAGSGVPSTLPLIEAFLIGVLTPAIVAAPWYYVFAKYAAGSLRTAP